MIYASSKDALHRRLEGIHIDLQATDYSEITKEASEFMAERSAAQLGRHSPFSHHYHRLDPSVELLARIAKAR